MPTALSLLQTNSEGYLVPKLERGLRFLFVGRSGSGKSNALVSLPKPLYNMDIDGRIKGIAPSILWLGQKEFDKISYDNFSPSGGFESIDRKLNQIANDAERGLYPYRTIGIESVGSLAVILALDSQRLRKAEKSFEGKKRGSVEFLHSDDYNYVSTAFRLLNFNYFLPLAQMGINVVLSAWVADKWGKDPSGGKYDPPIVVGERILAPGNFVEEVMGYFDEMYYFRRKPNVIMGEEPQFTIEFNGTFAKSSLGLPVGEVNITKKNFFQVWKKLVEETVGVKDERTTTAS
jgi:hypothetical protein